MLMHALQSCLATQLQPFPPSNGTVELDHHVTMSHLLQHEHQPPLVSAGGMEERGEAGLVPSRGTGSGSDDRQIFESKIVLVS